MLVSALLLPLYRASVLALGAVARSFTSEAHDPVVAMSTRLVAGVCRPVRRRLRSIVDRRFNRATYDAIRTAVHFGTRVRDEVELGGLTDELRRTAREALHPSSSTVWVRSPG